MKEVSVVVCSSGRQSDLAECLDSLAAQDYPWEKRETIVVTPPDDADTINLLETRFPTTVRTATASGGVSAARNRGTELARSPIVAFIDDDALATENWLSRLLVSFGDRQSVGCVGGRILLLTRFGIPPHLSRYSGYLGSFDQGNETHRVRYVFGSNMSFRKEVLLKAGGFNESLGRGSISKRDIMVNEEIELARRIRALRLEVVYEPTAVVFHKVSEDRLTWRYIVRRSFWQGVSDERTLGETSRFRRTGRILRQLLSAPRRHPLDTLAGIAYDLGRLDPRSRMRI